MSVIERDNTDPPSVIEDEGEAVDENENPFEYLPYEMLAEIFSKVNDKKRQQLRKVCLLWKYVIDNFHGIHLNISNLNWSWVENCHCAKTAKLSSFTRDVQNPAIVASRLSKLEITDFIAYYSLMPILEECNMLESLVINCVSFLPKSKLPEYTTSDYLDRRDEKSNWLPRLNFFKFVSVTTQTGVYNHLIPPAEEVLGVEDTVRSFDLSRGEMEFLPLMLRILMHTKSLAHIEMVLTDIWKIPFADLLQVPVDVSPMATDLSLWHFGSKRLLPVPAILHKLTTLETMQFSFPHHLDKFYMKFKPLTLQQSAPWQLEEVVVQQSLRWSQEMRDVDIPWLQILENQFHLRKIEYPFPIAGNDERMERIVAQNCKTLESIIFVGHRENRDQQENDWFALGQDGRLSWDSEWFSSCEKLRELHLKCHTRFLGPTSITALIKPNLLPHRLKHLTFHGCIDTGRIPLCVALCNLTNLETFSQQARLCPWFIVNEVPISELQIMHAKEVLMSMPHLKVWKLEWCDSSLAVVAPFVVNPDVQRQSACISNDFFNWITTSKDNIRFQDKTLDRQMKGITITILSHDKIFNLV